MNLKIWYKTIITTTEEDKTKLLQQNPQVQLGFFQQKKEKGWKRDHKIEGPFCGGNLDI